MEALFSVKMLFKNLIINGISEFDFKFQIFKFS